MSIKVEHLFKIFGSQTAVNDVSFEAHSGRILGFLGPNGAGKSTTMKILTTYLKPSSGKATLQGFDLSTQAAEIKKIVGYLPENNPLYREMYIKEYLHYVGEMYQLNNLSTRVAEVIQLTGLTKEQHKKINILSKGYRQRVGLAQAIIHEPKILILDEPTTGLDPNQLIEIRQLIQHLAKDKTVILSTHIMQEVEAICDDVVIINDGKIVANEPIAQLLQTHNSQKLEDVFVKLTKK